MTPYPLCDVCVCIDDDAFCPLSLREGPGHGP
jgi:hypothetical protein